MDDGEFGLAAFESQGCEGSDEEGATPGVLRTYSMVALVSEVRHFHHGMLV